FMAEPPHVLPYSVLFVLSRKINHPKTLPLLLPETCNADSNPPLRYPAQTIHHHNVCIKLLKTFAASCPSVFKPSHNAKLLTASSIMSWLMPIYRIVSDG